MLKFRPKAITDSVNTEQSPHNMSHMFSESQSRNKDFKTLTTLRKIVCMLNV